VQWLKPEQAAGIEFVERTPRQYAQSFPVMIALHCSPMSLIVDLLKDALKNCLRVFHASRRKRQHIFVLRAITLPRHDCGVNVQPTEGRRYDLATIRRNLYLAHLEAAIACYKNEDMTHLEAAIGSHQNEETLLPLLAVEQDQFRKELKAVQKRYGLPKLRDPKRAEKIEAILHDMEDKLRFHPPNFWSVK